MSQRENISYLMPRDPSITCWSDRVKLEKPFTKNLIQMELEREFEETMGDKIKVYLRLKPSPLIDIPYTVLDFNCLQTEAPKESVSYKNVINGAGKLIHKFTFTSILDQCTSQAALFKKVAVKDIKKFLSGENYLLMAYGTTSAGKTFTMQGNVEHPGVIPRALDFVFASLKDKIIQKCRYQPHQYNELLLLNDEQIRKNTSYKNFILSLNLTKNQRYPDNTHVTNQTMSSSGFSDMYQNATFKEMQSNLTDTELFDMNPVFCFYSVWVSMIEIYNERVYDLLEMPSSNNKRPGLNFKVDECGNTFFKDLRYVNVSSGHEAFQILQFGRTNLHMAPTALNETSSRSHCIFMVTLAKFQDYDLSSNAEVSRFSFCDLAGMERAKKTLNVKDRLEESKAINTSLSILVKCFTTIKENQRSKEKKMIPYRESKLTKLFKDAIMGKEQFSLIVNVNTEPHLFDETIKVLKFSSIAQKIVVQNIPIKPKVAKIAKRSRFSRIVSSNSSRVIDWEATTVTDLKIKESGSQLSDLQESEFLKCEQCDILKDELEKEKSRSENIEAQIREELTGQFSVIMKQLNENFRNRMESQEQFLKEMYEKKEQRLINYFQLSKRSKRQALEEDDYEDYQEQEERIMEAEENIKKLNFENEHLMERNKELVDENKEVVEKLTELKFKMAEKDRELELLKRATKANEEGENALVAELKKQLEEANAKVSNYKVLLNEAASDYKELEETVKFLKDENNVLGGQLIEAQEEIAEVKSENSDLQAMLVQKRVMIDKLEKANERLNKEVKTEGVADENLKEELEKVKEELKKTLENLEKREKELEELKCALENSGKREGEMEELKSALDNLEKKEKEVEELKSALKNSEKLEKEMEELKNALDNLEKKEKEVEELKSALENSEKLEREMEELKSALDNLEKREKEVEELKSALENSEKRERELEDLKKNENELKKKLEDSEIKLKDLEEEISKMVENNLKEIKEIEEKHNSEMDSLLREKMNLEQKCNDFNEEITVLQKELKEMIAASNKNKEKSQEVDDLLKEKEKMEKELIVVRKRISELEVELEEQIENLKTRERESKIALESLQAKFEAVEYQNTVMKNLKDEAEKKAYEMPQLYENIQKLEKEVENRERDLESFKENHQQLFKNYEKEIGKLKEENDRLRKDVLFANDVIAKSMTPLKSDKAEINRLKESVKKKDDEISKLKAEVNSIKKSEESCWKNVVSDSSSGKEDSPFANLKKKEEKRECTPEKLSKQIEALSIRNGKSMRKKVDQLKETIHPSTVEKGTRGKKKNGKKEKEKATESKLDSENIPTTKKKNCFKQLFTDNNFDSLTDLNTSLIEQDIPRLRPRK